MHLSRIRSALPAIRLGGLMAAGMLASVWYWFVVADRYRVFLYGHVDTPGRPPYVPAQPFDPVTTSRYWMAPFVAAAGLSVVYVTYALWRGRRARQAGTASSYRPAAWWQAWLVSAPVVALGVPWIVRTQNTPTLPVPTAALVTLTALLGLALAMMPGRLAARRPRRLVWLAADGLGLVPVLLFWRAVELPARGILETPTAISIAVGSVGVSVAWLLLMSRLQQMFGGAGTRPTPILLACAWWVLLFAPLAHHIAFTPAGYRYITSAQNVLGFSPATVIGAWAIALGLAWWITARRRAASTASGPRALGIGHVAEARRNRHRSTEADESADG